MLMLKWRAYWFVRSNAGVLRRGPVPYAHLPGSQPLPHACIDEICAFVQVGVCTFDSMVHYYSLKSNLSQPQLYVVPDLADPFLPVPDDLLVNLSDSRAVVETLLDSLAQASPCPRCQCCPHDVCACVALRLGAQGVSRKSSAFESFGGLVDPQLCVVDVPCLG